MCTLRTSDLCTIKKNLNILFWSNKITSNTFLVVDYFKRSVSVYYVAVRTIVLMCHGSSLARPVIIQILFMALCACQVLHIVDFLGLAGWKLCLRPLRFFYVQLKVSQTSHLIYVVLWAPQHGFTMSCIQHLAVPGGPHPINNRARRRLTSVIEPTPMRQRRIPLWESDKKYRVFVKWKLFLSDTK